MAQDLKIQVNCLMPLSSTLRLVLQFSCYLKCKNLNFKAQLKSWRKRCYFSYSPLFSVVFYIQYVISTMLYLQSNRKIKWIMLLLCRFIHTTICKMHYFYNMLHPSMCSNSSRFLSIRVGQLSLLASHSSR